MTLEVLLSLGLPTSPAMIHIEVIGKQFVCTLQALPMLWVTGDKLVRHNVYVSACEEPGAVCLVLHYYEHEEILPRGNISCE